MTRNSPSWWASVQLGTASPSDNQRWPLAKQPTKLTPGGETHRNPSPRPQEDIGKSYAKNEKKSTNKSGWTIHWQTVQLQLERIAPKFWTPFSIVLSVAEVAQRLLPQFCQELCYSKFSVPFFFSTPPANQKKEPARKTAQIKTFSHLKPPFYPQAWLARWTFPTWHLQDDIESRIGLQGSHLQLPCDKKGHQNTRWADFRLFLLGWGGWGWFPVKGCSIKNKHNWYRRKCRECLSLSLFWRIKIWLR